jgi:hypothetical protein
MYGFERMYKRHKNIKSIVAPLGTMTMKNGDEPVQKVGFALVRHFAEKSPGLGTRLLRERSELALWRARRGAWEQLGWLERANVPRGLQLAASMAAMGICRLTSAVRWR